MTSAALTDDTGPGRAGLEQGTYCGPGVRRVREAGVVALGLSDPEDLCAVVLAGDPVGDREVGAGHHCRRVVVAVGLDRGERGEW